MRRAIRQPFAGADPTSQDPNADRFQKMLEDAAPQLAEKLMPQNESQPTGKKKP